MEINSQICTTKEQSERLMALGLNTKTADCFLEYVGRDNYGNNVWHPNTIVNNYRMPDYSRDFPAWSLHRLLAMLTYQVIYNHTKYEPVIALDGMAYCDVCSDDTIVGWSGDLYTDVIDCIEWLIGVEQFNPDYLEQ